MKKAILFVSLATFLILVALIVKIPVEVKGDYLQVLSEPFNQTEVAGFGEPLLGGMRPTNFKTTLALSLGATASASEVITVTSLTTKDGHVLTSSDVGDFICAHINPGASNDEIVCCTGITSTTFTGCTRGYNFYSTGTTSGNAKAHSPGETFVISNDDHYLQTQYPSMDSSATISGQWTFTTGPKATDYLYYDETSGTTGFGAAASSSDLATKYYVDYVGAGGFTSLNVGTSYGLKALGTAPETVGIDLLTGSGLYFSGGDLGIYTSASQGLSFDDAGRLFFNASDSFNFTSAANTFVGASLTLTTPLDELYGGTGTVSWDKYDIPYISADNTFDNIASGSENYLLTMTEGVPSWTVPQELRLVSSNTLRASSNVATTSAEGAYYLVKEIKVRRAGIISVSFDMLGDNDTYTYGRIYIDGVATGTERSKSSDPTWTTYTEAITLPLTDEDNASASYRVQLKGYGNELYGFRNFGLYWDYSPVPDYEVIKED